MDKKFQANKQVFVDFFIQFIVAYTWCLHGLKKRDSYEWVHKLVASSTTYQIDHKKKMVLIWANIGIPHITSINSATRWMNTHHD